MEVSALDERPQMSVPDEPPVEPIPVPTARISALTVKIILVVGALTLLLIALEGLLKTVAHYSGERTGSVWQYFLAVDLMVVPLLLLGVLLGSGARYFERLQLTHLYQARLDRLQRRLDYREGLLKLVSDHLSGAIAIFDLSNRYWFVNQIGLTRTGKSVTEVIGKSIGRVLGGQQAKQLELRLAEARMANAPVEYVDRIEEKGETRFILSRYETVALLAELSGGVLVSESDITSMIVEREKRERTLRQVIGTLVAVVDRRDPYAAGHSARVGQLAHAIAEEMGLEPKMAEAAEIAGSLMNFGKVLVSRQVLTKTSALSPEELQRVRESILTSADIVSIIGFDGPVVPTLRQVLERYDGTGEPQGLKGEQIIVTARIVSVANAFVAFVSPRAHRDGLTIQDTMRCMMAEADHAYDHRVLIALSNYLENRPNKLEWLTSANTKDDVGASGPKT